MTGPLQGEENKILTIIIILTNLTMCELRLYWMQSASTWLAPFLPPHRRTPESSW